MEQHDIIIDASIPEEIQKQIRESIERIGAAATQISAGKETAEPIEFVTVDCGKSGAAAPDATQPIKFEDIPMPTPGV